MYRKLALASGVTTAVIFLAWCILGLVDMAYHDSQFMKDYGYTLGLLTLPFCCGLAPITGVMTIICAIVAMMESRADRKSRPGPPNQTGGLPS